MATAWRVKAHWRVKACPLAIASFCRDHPTHKGSSMARSGASDRQPLRLINIYNLQTSKSFIVWLTVWVWSYFWITDPPDSPSGWTMYDSNRSLKTSTSQMIDKMICLTDQSDRTTGGPCNQTSTSSFHQILYHSVNHNSNNFLYQGAYQSVSNLLNDHYAR